MDVKLLLDSSAAPELAQVLREEDGAEVKGVEPEKDLTEQAFGLAEATAILAAVKGAAELSFALWKFAKNRSKPRSIVVLESPLGTAKFELSQEMSVEDIKELTAPLFPAS